MCVSSRSLLRDGDGRVLAEALALQGATPSRSQHVTSALEPVFLTAVFFFGVALLLHGDAVLVHLLLVGGGELLVLLDLGDGRVLAKA